ncbi:MAG TPA: hypothetical protein VK716_13120 [Terracidiphilus sp.]|nr:hypothetical protein [Terracidiphilus sp.]
MQQTTEDQTRRRKVETLEQWAEMKTRRAVLDAVFDRWRDLFTRAAIQLESLSGDQVTADLKSLPPGADVDAALNEYRALTDQLVVLREQLKKMGLKVE